MELLVLKCQEGDVAAFDELVSKWQERLWRHAWRLTGNEDAAWDTLQDTLLGISKSIRKLEEPAAFPAWAYRIVSNKCRDWIRKECRRRNAHKSYEEQFQSGPDEPGPTVRSDDLQEALAQLSGSDRALLAMKYTEGFDVADIAEVLGIPGGTVKSRLYYARKRLRTIMEGDDNG
ncbi:RNA polymerase sigma factor [Candidatus Hydrogenedentota bacterium]